MAMSSPWDLSLLSEIQSGHFLTFAIKLIGISGQTLFVALTFLALLFVAIIGGIEKAIWATNAVIPFGLILAWFIWDFCLGTSWTGVAAWLVPTWILADVIFFMYVKKLK